MTSFPMMHELGRIDVVALEDRPALSRDVTLDLEEVQTAWPAFEGAFDSLQGRRMMGLIFGGDAVYRLATARLDRDVDNALGLDESIIPGGDYLRLRLRGEAPGLYGQIEAAFDVLFTLAHHDHDPERPHIESYRREGEIDCLVPIRPGC
ncbi:AraC family transcriptional regulator [Pseudoclavibacter sp. RFBJ3]|uniref:AraC family transcriptional regulator n=1 Tax=unclassified Pseudoclavibacter TaxID=2615177 RepID=UPI000CE7AD6E|nr:MULTISPECIES: AraC family transcriptional regulator [unclassified Pseudoclavibacter]PPF87233.1 AraC family transcriptional regulator [Pseudoclavibacter sp. RFBJ5]PPF89456.1 AraC family transcriptional regulator [Pseudoclavibacter sp. RFBJ3]PPG00739.1 AraC family transcriptional regulator [Pseudoclavibacter sp. RFBH5]PPG18847.1 AraC family transcriptional regulator [Pseudoclavibacter sp. RFBI4]